ncbi:MAG TPA: hypothetical protein VMG12_36280 [Polyangiaceae bacterium]|nr:hypothetical protein [Polyangiaceae bacterium]
MSMTRKFGWLVSAALFAVGFAACSGAEDDNDVSTDVGDPNVTAPDESTAEEVGEPNADNAAANIKPGEFFNGCFPFDSCQGQIPPGIPCRCDNSLDGVCDSPRRSAMFCR